MPTTQHTILAAFASMLAETVALSNGFGQTPIMGFNTYNAAACTINQTYVSNAINAFSSMGFLSLGYKYFQIDCGWQGKQRQSNGSITFDSSGFPDGITPLSKLAISKGFQWSMYTDEGYQSCDTGVDRPGSYGYETQDALQLAGWNVAYMKVDNCYATAGQNAPKDPRTDFPTRFSNMSTALQKVGINGMLICQWGVPYSSPTGLQGPSSWTPPLATSFRVSDDIADSWTDVMRIMNEAIPVNLNGLSGPGHFADMDLLEVGNPGMTYDEQASHFAIWAMFKSALMVSTAVQGMSSATAGILSNKALIAINQDALGRSVTLVQRFTNDYDLFAGPLANGDLAVLLLDQSNTQRTLSLDLRSLNISSATVTNLWTGASTAKVSTFSGAVNAHGSLPLRLSNIVRATPAAQTWTYIAASSGTLAGGANVQACAGCSNGQKVGYVGGSGSGGTLTFSNVYTSQATQDVRIDYLNCDIGYLGSGQTNVRGGGVRVNGGAVQPVQFPLSGYDWGRDVLRSYAVRLTGFRTDSPNTIEISGLAGSTVYAPDFDRIAVLK